MFDISASALVVFGVSALASTAVTKKVWHRDDPLVLKLATTVVAFLPVVGPLLALWVLNFPDRMHPDLRAKYKNVVNVYAVPAEALDAGAEQQPNGLMGSDQN